MSPNLYDLLDVDESASRDEIRAAWKAATGELDPTDRRFRAYNDAAAVLLDDEARAAYDARLAAERADDADAERADQKPDEDADRKTDAGPAVPPVTEPVPALATADGDATGDPDAMDPDAKSADAVDAGPSRTLLVSMIVLELLALALLVTVWALPGGHADPSPHEVQANAEQADEAGRSAQSAATDMVPVVLAYDYRTFDEDEDKARAYLTDDFAAERAKLLDGLKKDVVKGKVSVSAAVSGTGLTRVSDDGDKAEVVVYVDQESQRGKGAARPLHMWATFTLVRSDGGDWLLDGICTDQDCS